MRKGIAKDFDSDMGSGQFDRSGKDRLKWTEELHDLFEKAVTRLGGPDRATPKGIKRDMGIPELTIYHVKSHLQKYRMTKLIPESSTRSKFDRTNISEIMPNFSTISGVQLNEALLKIQKEAEMGVTDQFEVQRSLKRDIEAQRRYLERIAEDVKTRVVSIANSSNKAFSPKSLPSFCEDSDRKPEEFESDSEIYKTELWYQEESRAPKRPRTRGNANLLQKYMVPSVLDYI